MGCLFEGAVGGEIMQIDFLRPYVLVLIPIAAILLIVTGKRIRSKSRFRRNKYIVIRVMVYVLLILALSGSGIRLRSDQTTTIFMLDVSDSMKNQKRAAEEFVSSAVKKMPKNNKAGVVAFGKDAGVEQFVTDKKIFDSVESLPSTTATNIENAISKAMTLFSGDSAKRLVLLTDGAQNEGDMEQLSDSLKAQNVEFKVVKFSEKAGDEVFVSSLSLPDKANIGDTLKVNVTITSNVVTDAKVYLYSGRDLKAVQQVSLQKGENNYVFKDTMTEGGLKSYKVKIEAGQDTNTINNEYSAFTDVTAKPKILLVEGAAGNGKTFEKILEAAGYDYDKVGADGVPNNIVSMNEYKSILLLNVHADDLKKGFLSNLNSYVKDYAGGLVAIGGDNSFALGAYKDTPLETVLPVSMDLTGEKEIPKLAMAMVIDHSGSMLDTAGGNVTSLDLAKQAAVKGLESLRPTDELGVLAFDDRYDWAVPLAIASDIPAIEDGIAGISAGGGTSIYPALKEAVTKLKKTNAKLKHIILLTDGQDGFHEYEDVLNEINENSITLSTVAVGSAADTGILSILADKGNGRYYYTDINNNIPRIFAKEFYLSVKSYLIQEKFTPVIVNSSKLLSGVSKDGFPALLGYIASTSKSTATVVLESERGDPILTEWQYGLGKTIAWNSDGTNQWTANYAGWDGYLTLWKNIIDRTITDTGMGDDYVNIMQDGTSAKVIYETEDYDADTKVSAIYTKESGEKKKIMLDPESPGRFTASIDMEDPGVYSISIQNQKAGKIIKSMNTAAAMQYSPEYRYGADDSALTSFLKGIDGAMIKKPEEVFSRIQERIKARHDMTTVLLFLALLLFMIDVTTRRLNLHYLDDFVAYMGDSIERWKLSQLKNKKPIAEEKQENTSVIDQQQDHEKNTTQEKTKKPVQKHNKKKEKENITILDTNALLKKKEERGNK